LLFLAKSLYLGWLGVFLVKGMKIKEVLVEKLVSYLDYSHLKVGLKAEVEEGEKVEEVYAKLKSKIENMLKLESLERDDEYVQRRIEELEERKKRLEELRKEVEELEAWLREQEESGTIAKLRRVLGRGYDP